MIPSVSHAYRTFETTACNIVSLLAKKISEICQNIFQAIKNLFSSNPSSLGHKAITLKTMPLDSNTSSSASPEEQKQEQEEQVEQASSTTQAPKTPSSSLLIPQPSQDEISEEPPVLQEKLPSPASKEEQKQEQEEKESPIGPFLPVSWRNSNVSVRKALEKMVENAEKAIKEHTNEYERATSEKNRNTVVYSNPLLQENYLFYWTQKKDPYKKAQKPILKLADLTTDQLSPLTLKVSTCESVGKNKKKQMEDAHFIKKLSPTTFLAGVFDGHAGKDVSTYAAQEFPKKFEEALKNAPHIHNAFEHAIDQIQQQIKEKKSWNEQGSSAVISYIDQKTHLIYTATLGDCEANIYRKSYTGFSIPLSCVRDWLSPKDLKRLKECNDPTDVEEFILKQRDLYPSHPHLSKKIRSYITRDGFGSINAGYSNVARSFGGVDSRNPEYNSSPVTHKPKITIQKLKPNDTIVLASDGLKDYCFENQIIETIKPASPKMLAKTLVEKALENMTKQSYKNITAISITVSNQ